MPQRKAVTLGAIAVMSRFVALLHTFNMQAAGTAVITFTSLYHDDCCEVAQVVSTLSRVQVVSY